MTTSPIRFIWNHPVEIATAALFVVALFYIGSSSGGAFIFAIFGAVGAAAAAAEIHIRIGREREKVEAARRAVANSPEGKTELSAVTGLATFVIVMAEVLWYVSAFIPHPKYGVLVTTPTAWVIAHVTALSAALVAYRHSPMKYRTLFTVATAAFVISSLAIASNIPFKFAQ